MADAERRSATAAATAATTATTGAVGLQRQAPTRLQSRAPASIEIKRPSNWNVAIPLLSPLVSPSCGNSGQEEVLVVAAENKAREEAQGQTFTKWQHPAAPFYYGPVPRAPFVPV